MVKAAREGGDAMSKQRVIDTSDYVHCPHCDRNFDQDVAERHVPICSELSIKAKYRSNNGASNQKKLSPEKDLTYKKRMGYRPPLPKTSPQKTTNSSSPVKSNAANSQSPIQKVSPMKTSYR